MVRFSEAFDRFGFLSFLQGVSVSEAEESSLGEVSEFSAPMLTLSFGTLAGCPSLPSVMEARRAASDARVEVEVEVEVGCE